MSGHFMLSDHLRRIAKFIDAGVTPLPGDPYPWSLESLERANQVTHLLPDEAIANGAIMGGIVVFQHGFPEPIINGANEDGTVANAANINESNIDGASVDGTATNEASTSEPNTNVVSEYGTVANAAVSNAAEAIAAVANGAVANEVVANEAVVNGAVANGASPQELEVADATNEAPAAQTVALSPVLQPGGIMYGLKVTQNVKGHRVYSLNNEVPKTDSKVFGHNGLAVGAWFANRLVALHRGAHGSSMGGIYGKADQGAYSIVVADNYADLDEDKGDILYYSGSNSHGNMDPMSPAPSSTGTKALKTSMNSNRLVRVLRSGKERSKNRWAPECGVRYDGLYRVIALRERVNKKGGLYEQFILHREPNQTPLATIRRSSPTGQEKFDLAAFQQQG